MEAVFEAFIKQYNFFVGERNVGFVNHSGLEAVYGSPLISTLCYLYFRPLFARGDNPWNFVFQLAHSTARYLTLAGDVDNCCRHELWGAYGSKVISTICSECIFLALGTQHAMLMRHIAICGLPGSTIFSHDINGRIFENKLIT